jgi:hypothetical protein
MTWLIKWKTFHIPGKLNMLHMLFISLWLHATFTIVSTIIRGKNLINSSGGKIVALNK